MWKRDDVSAFAHAGAYLIGSLKSLCLPRRSLGVSIMNSIFIARIGRSCRGEGTVRSGWASPRQETDSGSLIAGSEVEL
jgi:hypothetical protein